MFADQGDLIAPIDPGALVASQGQLQGAGSMYGGQLAGAASRVNASVVAQDTLALSRSGARHDMRYELTRAQIQELNELADAAVNEMSDMAQGWGVAMEHELGGVVEQLVEQLNAASAQLAELAVRNRQLRDAVTGFQRIDLGPFYKIYEDNQAKAELFRTEGGLGAMADSVTMVEKYFEDAKRRVERMLERHQQRSRGREGRPRLDARLDQLEYIV